ncbi:MAG: hypothetical protein KH111_05165, partial [Bacteroidales bacterium]|nr:hypothetical protein [Bacteroidales bacterium]
FGLSAKFKHLVLLLANYSSIYFGYKSKVHRGRNERKERYNVSMQHILPLGKGKPEGGQSKI